MNRFFSFFRFFMLGALVCSAVCCGKDKVDPPVALIPAFVTIEATDASLSFLGDAESREITVKTNRGITVTVDAAATAWLTATVSATDAATSTAKLTLAATKNETAYKGRSATISIAAIATPGRDDDLTVSDASAKASLTLKQAIFGLPTADLLDVVFTIGGTGCAARDISPAANVITDGLPKSDEGYACSAKVYPTVSNNALYGRPTAHFAGGTWENNETVDVGSWSGFGNKCNNGRGSCFYRVDLANYSIANLSNYYNKDAMTNNEQIPFTALGEGIMKGSYSVEVIFKPAQPAFQYNRGKVLGWTQSCGGSVDFSDTQGDHHHRLGFYNDMAPEPYGTSNGGTEPMSPDGSANWEDDVYYHLIGVYDQTNEVNILYVDGVEIDRKTSAGLVVKLANPKSTDALSQWLGIGGDCRRADPIVNGQALHINTDYENWCEFAYTGEVVLVRFYGRTLSATEITTLYEYEKPVE
jgi:hypothetical protein